PRRGAGVDRRGTDGMVARRSERAGRGDEWPEPARSLDRREGCPRGDDDARGTRRKAVPRGRAEGRSRAVLGGGGGGERPRLRRLLDRVEQGPDLRRPAGAV